MKLFITLVLLINTVITFGQSNIEFDQLTNSWQQGKIDSSGNIVKANISRGGWSHLMINSDSTVKYSGPLNCGFGSSRQGKWSLNTLDTTVTFYFEKSIGYGNSPGTTDINEIETYKISRLTADAIVLTRIVEGKEIILPFIKSINK